MVDFFTSFNKLGYKVADVSQYDYIVKDFQRHAGITPDGVIGPITKSKISYYNKKNYCPEVFEPIKPYTFYTSEQIENLCTRGLDGLGNTFNYYSKLNNFDVLHNLAHAILESAYGTSAIANKKNNIYGWAAYDSSPMYSAHGFLTKADCIEEWSNWFNMTYLIPTGNQFRGNNEYCVNIVYASSSIAGINKSFIVQILRRKLNDTRISP